MSLADEVDDLADRLATEFNTVRGELSSGLAGKAASSHTHAESDVAGLTSDLAAKVPTSRTVTASTGLTGGGALSADIALSVAYGTTSTTACVGNDSRLSDARTPTAHASSHATAGGDPIAPSDIGAVPTSRTVSAGTGLSGGGDLSANRSLSISFGTSSTTACVGNDSRLSDARTPTAHKSTHATGGTDALSASDIGAQASNSNLTTIAGLTPGSGNVLAADGSGWVSKTYAALKTALSLVKGDVGLGNVDNTSDATKNSASVTLTNKTLTSPVINSPTGIVKGDVGLGNVDNTSDSTKNSAAATLTNKRVTKRVGTTTSSSTPTADADSHDMYTVTAAAANMTVGSPTGTPTDGQMILYRFKDNGTARTIAWNAIFRPVGITLPTTTVISKTLYVLTIYNSADSKWDGIASGQEA